MKKIMQNKLFLVSFLSDLVSNFGDSVFYLALINYMMQLPEREATFAVSLVTLSETVPYLFNIFTGYWADKTTKILPSIFITQIIRAALYGVVGVVLGFTPALWIVIVIVMINFISDLLGKYESGLFIPISMAIVSNDDREMFMSFQSSAAQTLHIAFQGIGSLLLLFVSYQWLAGINAFSFLVAAFILFTIIKPLSQRLKHRKKEQKKIEKRLPFIRQMKLIYEETKSYPLIFDTIIVLCFINGAFSGILTLILQTMNLNRQFVLVNPAVTMTILNIVFLSSSIIGSLLNMSISKNVTLTTVTKIASLLSIAIYVSLLIQNIVFVVICLFAVGLSGGILSPKFSALILNTLPEETLATTTGLLNTILPMGTVVMSVVVSILLPIIPVHLIVILFIFISVVVFLMVYIRSKNAIIKVENEK